ncbi:hypothetical protein V1264_003474 [Littorina saxatilis]|uniref:PNPLA domain-containing protein n=2 Tax=Littorina saxatilis TaxID=31220 RepID=A0AAN9B526_9CAEN
MSEPKNKITFSLAGCGFLGIYHIGVAACLREHVPHLLDDDVRVAGASAGALIGACLICNVSLNHCVDFTLRLAKSSRQHPLGGWEPGVDIEGILRKSLEFVLPENAHIICTNRLFVSCSSFKLKGAWPTSWGVENEVISEFKTRKDLLDVLMCSAFIPGFSAYTLPSYKGRYLFDGGLTDNIPVLNKDTITVSPWAGEHSICPRDSYGQTFPLTVVNTSICPTGSNLVRFNDAFNPPTQEFLKRYCWQGYDACLTFLAENDLIHCSSHRVFTHLVHMEERRSTPKCEDCQNQREHALHSELSADLLEQLSKFEDEAFSRGLGTLVATPVKTVVSFLAIPFVMLKDWVAQLYLGAYFGAKSEGYLQMCSEMVESLNNPKILLYNLTTNLASKCIFTGLEYLARVVSVMVTAGADIVSSSRSIIRSTCRCACNTYTTTRDGVCEVCSLPVKIVCKVCGVVGNEISLKEGQTDLKGLADQRKNQLASRRDSVSAKTPAAALASEEEADKSEQNAAMDSAEVPQRPFTQAKLDEDYFEEPADMAVVLDIEVKKVDMAISISAEDEDGEKDEDMGEETVNVEGVGSIEKVHFDSVSYTKNAEDVPEVVQHHEPRVDKLHQYVHKFEQYKPVVTMHYIDENNVQHTESLFVHDTPQDCSELPEASARPSARAEGATTARSEEGAEEQRGRNERSSRGQQKVHYNVDVDLKNLLEEKVLKPQREFQKEYQQAHQKRLKKKHLSEAGGSSGRYRLQVVSFTEDLPSPSLSRSSSIRNVSMDDMHLVHSVSDASSLAGSVQDLRSFAGGKAQKQRKLWWEGRGDLGSLAASKQFSSMQSLNTPPSPGLRRSASDTVCVASALKELKIHTNVAESLDVLGKVSQQLQSKASKVIVKVTEDPPVTDSDFDSAFAADRSGSFSSVSMTPTLPAIQDVSTSSGSSDSEHEEAKGKAKESKSKASSNRKASQNKSKFAGEPKASEDERHGSLTASREKARLERSRSNLKSTEGKKSLLTTLKELKLQRK